MLIAFAIGLVAAIALPLGCSWLSRWRWRRIEARQRAGELPANDNFRMAWGTEIEGRDTAGDRGGS